MIRIAPPRHQGHQAHPPTSQTRRHEGTKKSQSPPTHPIETADHTDERRYFRSVLDHPAPSTSLFPPPAQKRRGAETQRRRGALAGFLCVARSRPSSDGMHHSTSFGETPWPTSGGHGATGSGNRFESELSCRFPDPVACALEERGPRHLSSSFNSWEGYASLPHKKEERQNRRATGTLAGEKTDSNGCLHPESSGFSPATGDQQIACRSAFNKRDRISSSVPASLRLCVFAGRVVGRALRSLRFKNGRVGALRLCVSAPLRFSWCRPLVSWCLGGFSFPQPSENPS
jgi:hypothetical protein